MMSMTDKTDGPVLAIIPARYASTRFPGKPLAMIFGKPMLQHVWERIKQTPSIHRVIIATDDDRIREAAEGFGAEVCMTSPDHPSGTDRLWEVAKPLQDYQWILNVQGDEPFINPEHLQAILDGRHAETSRSLSLNKSPDILTLVTPLSEINDWHNPNIVKAILSPLLPDAKRYQALYFSRAAVPFHRDIPESSTGKAPPGVFRHLGLYLYKRSALQIFVSLPVSPLEAIEKLEQLRALEAGLSIAAVSVDSAPIGVDTPEDLSRITESS
jgi:3-deoxy-manno-octulosonate cytidylyltransferase (CMP-KDO synthetase)